MESNYFPNHGWPILITFQEPQTAFAYSVITLALILTYPSPLKAEDIEHISVKGQSLTAKSSQQALAKTLKSQLAATSDTASLLSRFAGVSTKSAGAVSGLPSIRGLADDRLRIQVDGMDLVAACPNHMNPPLSYQAPADIGKIQVFAGVTPVSLGGDSIGGTIISESVAPKFSDNPRFEGNFGAFYRSNNQARGSHLKLSQSDQQHAISYSGNWSQGNNYRAAADFKTQTASGRPNHLIALDEVASSAFETQNHQLRLARRHADDLFEVQLGYQQMPFQGFPNQRMDLLENEQQRVNLSWQRDTSWGQLHSRIYQEKVEHVMDFGPDRQFWYGSLAGMGRTCEPIRFHGDPAGTCAAGMPMYSESTNRGANVSSDINLSSKSLLRLGSAWQQFQLDDYWTASGGAMGLGTFLNINNGRRSRVALYAEHELALTNTWLIQYGARHEWVRRDADPVTGYSNAANAMGMQAAQAAAFNQADREHHDDNLDLSLLSRYQLTPQWQFELALAQKSRSANLYETYTWSSWAMAASMNNLVGDGNGYVGNLSLRPERARLVALGLQWQSADQQHQISLKPYLTHVDDYIDAVAINSNWKVGQFNILQYQNQQAELKGMDLTAETQLADNSTGNWQLLSTVSYVDACNTDTEDSLHQTQPLHARFGVTQQLAGWENSLEWQLTKRKTSLSAIRGEQPTPGFGVLNLRFSHSWQQLRVDLGVENMLDKFYFQPQGGVYTAQGMTMSLNGIPFGLRMPGMGRSIHAGFNYAF